MLDADTGSHPARGAWIEMSDLQNFGRQTGSHPARGAWIEIALGVRENEKNMVAPRTGCVD